jgi:hypothetical protein
MKRGLPLDAMRGVRIVAALGTLCLTGVAGIAGVPGCVGVSVAASTAGDEIAPAERLIFMTTHLEGVEPQTELDYAVDFSGPPVRVTDTVRVLVLSRGNGKGDARITDRTGKVEVPGEGLPCNPVILYFLEHDIAEMEQLTGGQRRYFQRRVRLALAAGPPLMPVVAQSGGKSVKAQKIVIQPYVDDPNAARFAQYTGKRYTFLLADDAVPGRVMQIRTEVPGAGNDFAHPLQTETLTFAGALRSLAPGKPGGPPPVKSPQAPRASR